MSQIRELNGQRFGRLRVISFSHLDRRAFWNCHCDCGNDVVTQGIYLTVGLKKSCGCLKKEASANNLRKYNVNHRREKHYSWKGDDVGYRALHVWVRKELGIPKKCAKCGAAEVKKKRTNIQYANISKEYLRNVNDWIALCVSCHRNADINKVNLRYV